MFEDPAYPSMPPGPDEDSVRPMSIIGAAMWAWGAQIAFISVASLMVALRESAENDLVGRALCQVVGYSLALYLVLRVHGPESRIRDFLALRPTKLAFYPLAIVLGVAATLPTYWLLAQVQSLFPSEPDPSDWLDLFYQMSFAERMLVAGSTVVLGPLVEEAMFRGALFRPLGKDHSPLTVVLVTGVFFALVHLSAERLLPLTLLGIALGHVRWASGSLVPSLLVHMSFNAVPFSELLRHGDRPPDDPIDPRLTVGFTAVAIVALLCIQLLGRRRARGPG
jgi:CAAX protease family protein